MNQSAKCGYFLKVKDVTKLALQQCRFIKFRQIVNPDEGFKWDFVKTCLLFLSHVHDSICSVLKAQELRNFNLF